MNSSETSVLATGELEFPDLKRKSSLITVAVQNGDLDSVKALLKYKVDNEARGGVFCSLAEVKEKYPSWRNLQQHVQEGDVCYIFTTCTPLFIAAANGNIDILRCLIENGADINAYAYKMCTPLMKAVKNCHVNVVTFLIKHGANVDLRDEDGDTALHYACIYHGSLEVLSCLIENGADINAFSAYNCTPLMTAIANGHINAVTFLIEHGANVDLQDKEGDTALHYACVNDTSPEVFSRLTENGANLNASSKDKMTPLMIAAKDGHINAVTFLIEHGSNVDLQDQHGNTALHHAVLGSEASCEILSCLIENGADINALTRLNCTPLMIAAEEGHENAVTFLIKRGANVDLRDFAGGTALHRAVSGPDASASCEILKCLIEIGADVNACGKNKTTPLMMACKYGHLNAVTFLIKHGANVDLKNKCGYTALHHACNFHSLISAGISAPFSLEILSCLIKNGADVNARTVLNRTPLMILASNLQGQVHAMNLLIEYGAKVGLQDTDGATALHHAVDAFSRTPHTKTSTHGEVNAVTFLTEHGANMDIRDNDGNTVLHYAVSVDGVHTLLTLGASYLIPVHNKQGLTRLLDASDKVDREIVEYLIERPEITREHRIDALELLGASIITQCDDLYLGVEGGFKYIKRGMEERFADPSQPLLKRTMEPVKAYQNRKECQTLQELALIEDDLNAVVMESLNIRERILGKENAELLFEIRNVASKYFDHLDFSTSLELYRHAVKIAQSSNESSASDLKFILSECLVNAFIEDDHPEQKDVLELLEQTVVEYEKQYNGKIETDDEEDNLQDLFHCSVQLMSLIPKFVVCGESNTSNAPVLLRKLCRRDPRDNLGNTLLHDVIKNHVDDDSFPLLDALKLLLNAGFNVNAVNNKGNTPLHLAVTLKPRDDKIHLLTKLLEVLFDGGAHHDFVNNDGKTPMDMAQTDEAHMILSERRKLELKCISARAVKKFGIPYLWVVPTTLEKYISMH